MKKEDLIEVTNEDEEVSNINLNQLHSNQNMSPIISIRLNSSH